MQLRVLQQNANRCPGTGHAEKGPSPPQPASQDAHVLVPRLSRPTSPRKRAASTRFVKLLVITRLLSFVGSSSVIAFTLGSSWKVVASFPGGYVSAPDHAPATPSIRVCRRREQRCRA